MAPFALHSRYPFKYSSGIGGKKALHNNAIVFKRLNQLPRIEIWFWIICHVREKVLVTIFFAVCYFKFMESTRCADGVVYGLLAMPLSECNLWNFILKVISHGITAIKTTYVQYAQ